MATNNSSSLISSIYKSRNILLELMESQGYNINDNFDQAYKGWQLKIIKINLNK